METIILLPVIAYIAANETTTSERFARMLSNASLLEIPREFLEVSSQNWKVIIAYSIFFIIGAIGNLSVLLSVYGQLGKLKWRITVLIVHLSIADLIVTFLLIPSEIVWKLTIRWAGGNLLCKLCQFSRVFGLYLSSMVIICISLDRFSAIVYPLKMAEATKRVKIMLASAWIAAGLFSLPQVFVFRLERHPIYGDFEQCVSSGFLSSSQEEIIYNVFHVVILYFVPLGVILVTYGTILCKINKKAREQLHPREKLLRRHQVIITNTTESAVLFVRARSRTLRLAITIVLPYVLITLWYMFGRTSAEQVEKGVQEGLFMMVVANSCLNPCAYSNYARQTLPPPPSIHPDCLKRRRRTLSPATRRTTDLPVNSVI